MRQAAASGRTVPESFVEMTYNAQNEPLSMQISLMQTAADPESLHSNLHTI